MEKRQIPAFVTFILIAAATASMIFGISRGEVNTVVNKAVNICMECIGLG